jgi:uncharacterized protein (TIGR04255 family)
LIKIPQLIDHGHIIESVVEIRFVPANEHTAFLDIVAAARSHVTNYSFHPAEIPRQIRQSDPQFEYSVEGSLNGEEYSIGIGSNTLVFNCVNGYKKWSEFFPFIKRVLETAAGSIREVVRIGVRYTNFFEGMNDLSNFNVGFFAGAEDLKIEASKVHQMVLKFAMMSEVVSYNVTVANQASVPRATSPGALLDVDAYLDHGLHSPVGKQHFDQIDLVHSKEKEMFFVLLKDEFLKTLNPKY